MMILLLELPSAIRGADIRSAPTLIRIQPSRSEIIPPSVFPPNAANARPSEMIGSLGHPWVPAKPTKARMLMENKSRKRIARDTLTGTLLGVELFSIRGRLLLTEMTNDRERASRNGHKTVLPPFPSQVPSARPRA